MIPCPGKRTSRGSLLGICSLCQRQDDKSTTPPPAAKNDRDVWTCVALVPPAGWPKPAGLGLVVVARGVR